MPDIFEKIAVPAKTDHFSIKTTASRKVIKRIILQIIDPSNPKAPPLIKLFFIISIFRRLSKEVHLRRT